MPSLFRRASTDKCGTGRGKSRESAEGRLEGLPTTSPTLVRAQHVGKGKTEKGEEKSQAALHSLFFPKIESSFTCQRMSAPAPTVSEIWPFQIFRLILGNFGAFETWFPELRYHNSEVGWHMTLMLGMQLVNIHKYKHTKCHQFSLNYSLQHQR